MSAPAFLPPLLRLWQSLPKAALGNLVAKLLMVSLGLAITVLVARQGPAVQGAFALFVACESGLLTLFSGWGLWLARRVSRQQAGGLDGQGAARVRPALGWGLRASVVLGVVAALALWAASRWIDRAPYSHLWLLALAAPFLLLVPTATGLWLGQGRMWPLNAAQVAAPASVLLALTAILAGPSGREAWTGAAVVTGVLAAWVGGKSVVALATAGWALRDAARFDALRAPEAVCTAPAGPAGDRPQGGADWRFIGVIGLTNVISLLNFRASLFLVEHFQGLAVAGTYSVAVTVAELLWLLSSSVTVAVYARIGHPDRAWAAHTTLHAVRINLAVTALAAPFLLVGAGWALPRVLGVAYAASVAPLAALLPGVALYAAASSLSAFYTNHLGRPMLSGVVASLSLAVSLALGAWSVPRWGALGAGLATSAGYAVAIVVAWGLFVRASGLPWHALWRTPRGAGEPRSADAAAKQATIRD